MTTRGEDRKGFHPSWMRTLPMTKALASEGSPTQPQPVAIPLTRAAIFLVVAIKPGAGNRSKIRSFCADLAALVRSVGFRELEGSLSCVLGFGSEAWDRLFGQPRPAELHKFHEIHSGERHAVSTPGDMLFPYPRAADGSLLRAGDANHGPAWTRNLPSRRGAWIPVLRQPRPHRLRRRNRES